MSLSRRRPSAILAVVAALVFASAGCSGGESGGDPPVPTPGPMVGRSDAGPESPSEPASPSVAESATDIDVSAVPPVDGMTVEYVEAVVNTIEAASGEIFAAVLAEPVNTSGTAPQGVADGLEHLFARDRLDLKIEEAEALARSEEARALVLPAAQYSGVRFRILQVSYAEPGCIVAVGQLNRDGTTPAGGDDSALSIVSLVRAQSASDLNPTRWLVAKALPNRGSDGSVNSEEFARAATLDQLEGVLPHDCEGGEASRVAPSL